MNTVTANLPPEKLRKLVVHIPRAISGKDVDTYKIAEKFWSAVAYSLFSSIFNAFLLKSQHKEDDLGNTWKDHSEKYKAYGIKEAREGLQLYDNRAVKNPALRVRPTLPPAVNRQWAGRWFGLYIGLQSTTGESAAKQQAGASTWDHFKAKGYPTLISLTRNKKLPILNRTGVLQRKVFPAPLRGGLYIPLDRNQIYAPDRGSLTIGIRHDHIEALDEIRPIWPRDIGPWISKAVGEGRDALHKFLPEVIRQIQ